MFRKHYSIQTMGRASTRGVPAGQLLGKPTCKEHQDVAEKTENMVLVNSGFHMRTNFYKNDLQFGQKPQICHV